MVKVLKDIFSKINLILFNFYLGLFYICLSNLCIDRFVKVFMEYGFIIVVCKMWGDDIDVVCG